MKYLQNAMASYYDWRKGVLMLMPLDFILLSVVSCLFIVTFIVSLTSTKGPVAISALKQYLGSLQHRLDHLSMIDAEAERSGTEKLLNNVKASCHQFVISRDSDLKFLLRRAYEQMNALTNSRADDTKTSWIKLRSVTQGFGKLYFIDFEK